MSKSPREGLLWEDSGLDLEPRWRSELSLEAIKRVCQRTLQLDAPDDCAVSFLAAGAFNRLYLVEDSRQQKFVIRISLPVDPHYKTAGEVATLRWLKRHSDIPVSRVTAFDDSDSDEIGFEWILMQLMPGTSAYQQWRKLTLETKKALVENIAEYHAQLFKTSAFRTIGTLKDDNLSISTRTTPGRIVSRMFFWGPHFDYDIPRGPFRSSHDWLKSFITIILQDHTTEIKEAEDEEDKEDAEYSLRVAQMLADLLPKIFLSIQNPPERTVLWHDDLSLQNIMIDDKGAITAVIDWECVSAMPLWVATQMPKFLCGEDRAEEPRRDQYGNETPEDVAARQETDYDNGLDNEGKNGLFWIHLMEYEQTQLRKVYSDRMSRLWTGWDEAVADGALKADFFGAVVRCADGFSLKRIEAWVAAINRGEFHRLADTLRPTFP
ncbi:phosphotransferase enzyme family-domain-containing protein [Dactylonectria macrodidyma]|uniref:Phosphotransferase enzyme family-domain-containing protein n=1 Tax=Dactylonectria macrodidyma TaxID=307937 RepID=A0A9P9IVU5_9HYPO|nr:phosphotransferase enzyme family-domain-containing protein [Dactylonectria macrodidyma]